MPRIHCHLCFVAEYDSDTSCHYKVELSYENFITSGPNSHPPPIADDESDDDDDDDIPQVRGTALAELPSDRDKPPGVILVSAGLELLHFVTSFCEPWLWRVHLLNRMSAAASVGLFGPELLWVWEKRRSLAVIQW